MLEKEEASPKLSRWILKHEMSKLFLYFVDLRVLFPVTTAQSLKTATQLSSGVPNREA